MIKKISTSLLLQRSTKLCLSRAVPVLVGIVFFGTISAACALYMESKIRHSPLEQIQEAMESGQLHSMDELEALNLLSTLMPVVQIMLWSALLSFIISCFSSLYFLHCTTLKDTSIYKICIRFALSIPRMILILAWSSARSFAWVPMVGPIIGLFLFPRFLFAPVISIQDRKGAIASVRESYHQTKGYTWYLLSAISIISLVAAIVAILAIGIFSLMLDPMLGKYSVFLRSMIWQASIAYTIAGISVLWMNNEQKKSAD